MSENANGTPETTSRAVNFDDQEQVRQALIGKAQFIGKQLESLDMRLMAALTSPSSTKDILGHVCGLLKLSLETQVVILGALYQVTTEQQRRVVPGDVMRMVRG